MDSYWENDDNVEIYLMNIRYLKAVLFKSSVRYGLGTILRPDFSVQNLVRSRRIRSRLRADFV